MKKRSAVSLAEILVVIAIVAIVIVLSIPAFVNAKESAKVARSKSNLRQLATLIRQYSENEPGPGPNGLGLPHSAIAFYGQAFSGRPVPLGLVSTGGSTWQSPESSNAAYNWMMPDMATLTEMSMLDALPYWLYHVSNTQENPVLLLDATFPLEFGIKANRRIFGVYYDTHLAQKKYGGPVGQLRPWE